LTAHTALNTSRLVTDLGSSRAGRGRDEKRLWGQPGGRHPPGCPSAPDARAAGRGFHPGTDAGAQPTTDFSPFGLGRVDIHRSNHNGHKELRPHDSGSGFRRKSYPFHGLWADCPHDQPGTRSCVNSTSVPARW
jgi:hypothetical protein